MTAASEQHPSGNDNGARHENTVRICNRRGLHARAAAKFVRMVDGFKQEQQGLVVRVAKDDMEVCGSSISFCCAANRASPTVLPGGAAKKVLNSRLVASYSSGAGQWLAITCRPPAPMKARTRPSSACPPPPPMPASVVA